MFCEQGGEVRSTVCAIKQIKGHHKGAIKDFEHEVDVLKKLTGRHPNVVRMLVGMVSCKFS